VVDVRFVNLAESFELESVIESFPKIVIQESCFRSPSVRYVFETDKYDSLRIDCVLELRKLSITINPSDTCVANSVLPIRGIDGNWCSASIPVLIFDESHPLHPPLVVNVNICILNSESSLIPSMPSLPVSKTNRKKDYMERQGSDSISSTAVQSSTNQLRIRGLTPSTAFTDQYEISLGQQTQKFESIEWMLTLENTSATLPLAFYISSVPSDCSWLSVGQTNGNISHRNSASLMLYFSKIKVGIYFAYVTVLCISNPGEIHILRINMEVVQDSSVFNMKPLYRVVTALSLDEYLALHSIFEAPSSASIDQTTIDEHLDKLLIDFCEVYPGSSYCNRSFVIYNTSDILLEFSLSSTFDSSVLQLPQAVSVKPKEQVLVAIKFTPNKESSVLNEFNDGIISGEIFISCRLVKDHHDRVKLLAVLKSANLTITTIASEPVSMYSIACEKSINIAIVGDLTGILLNESPLEMQYQNAKGFQYFYYEVSKGMEFILTRSSEYESCGSLVIYNRDHPTEKYRIFDQAHSTNDYTVSPTTINSDCSLEGAVEVFIQKFLVFSATLPTIEFDIPPQGCNTLQKVDLVLDGLICEQYCQIDESYTHIGYVKQISVGSKMSTAAKTISDLHFELFSITDKLISRSLNAVKLAQLMFTTLYSHPVFSYGSNRSLPKLLVPFAKQILYYLSFFPRLEDEALVDLAVMSKDLTKLLQSNSDAIKESFNGSRLRIPSFY
jgi:hypothetical protein